MKALTKIILLGLLLSSCSMNEIPERLIPKEANEFAQKFIIKLANGEIDYCDSLFSKEYQNDQGTNFLNEVNQAISEREVLNYRLISSSWTTLYSGTTSTTYNLQYEYKYADDFWIYYSFQILEKNNNLTVNYLNFQPRNESLSSYYEFNFKNKTIIHYTWLFMAILVPIFILFSVIYAIRTPLKRKWLWIIFILVGFVSFSLNWATGDFGIKPINFNLLGAGIIKSGIIAPWILTFNIPIGAILFWIKRNRVSKNINNNNTTKNIGLMVDSAVSNDASNK
jgi:hypothetical protein